MTQAKRKRSWISCAMAEPLYRAKARKQYRIQKWAGILLILPSLGEIFLYISTLYSPGQEPVANQLVFGLFGCALAASLIMDANLRLELIDYSEDVAGKEQD